MPAPSGTWTPSTFTRRLIKRRRDGKTKFCVRCAPFGVGREGLGHILLLQIGLRLRNRIARNPLTVAWIVP